MTKILLGLIFLFNSFYALAIVNINTASQEQLQSLNGIGPAKAEAIVQFRQKNGPFQTPDDLAKVKGIGNTTLLKLKHQITTHQPNLQNHNVKPNPIHK